MGPIDALPALQSSSSSSSLPARRPQHPQAPGTANSALEHVLRSEWRERFSAHKAAPKANAQGPGLAGAVRTQKNRVEDFEPPRSRPDQNGVRGWGPLSLHWGI
eukprot:gene17559-biopygen14415